MSRLAIIRDFREEGWPSMDLVADKLLEHWPTGDAYPNAVDIAPAYRRCATRMPLVGAWHIARNVDRGLNRYRLLPAHVRKLRGEFEYFHIADHSYAHLVYELPGKRTGVYCHDLDTFRCLLEPAAERRSRWFRSIAGRVLKGVQGAAVVFHSTLTMGRMLTKYCSIPAERLCHVPLGVDDAFFVDDAPTDDAFLGQLAPVPFVLHVGSCISRKRVDVLLEVFAGLAATSPDLRLVKIGDAWPPAQQQMLDELRLNDRVTHLGKVDPPTLIEAYRRAALTLIPSDAEGFGLPVIEALACGGAVLASDLPTLREAGGDVAQYAPVGDVAAWRAAALSILARRADAETVERRRNWARRFSWPLHARTIADAYRRLSTTG